MLALNMVFFWELLSPHEVIGGSKHRSSQGVSVRIHGTGIYIYIIYLHLVDVYGKCTRFFKVTSFEPTSDLFGA